MSHFFLYFCWKRRPTQNHWSIAFMILTCLLIENYYFADIRNCTYNIFYFEDTNVMVMVILGLLFHNRSYQIIYYHPI